MCQLKHMRKKSSRKPSKLPRVTWVESSLTIFTTVWAMKDSGRFAPSTFSASCNDVPYPWCSFFIQKWCQKAYLSIAKRISAVFKSTRTTHPNKPLPFHHSWLGPDCKTCEFNHLLSCFKSNRTLFSVILVVPILSAWPFYETKPISKTKTAGFNTLWDFPVSWWRQRVEINMKSRGESTKSLLDLTPWTSISSKSFPSCWEYCLPITFALPLKC